MALIFYISGFAPWKHIPHPYRYLNGRSLAHAPAPIRSSLLSSRFSLTYECRAASPKSTKGFHYRIRLATIPVPSVIRMSGALPTGFGDGHQVHVGGYDQTDVRLHVAVRIDVVARGCGRIGRGGVLVRGSWHYDVAESVAHQRNAFGPGRTCAGRDTDNE